VPLYFIGVTLILIILARVFFKRKQTLKIKKTDWGKLLRANYTSTIWPMIIVFILLIIGYIIWQYTTIALGIEHSYLYRFKIYYIIFAVVFFGQFLLATLNTPKKKEFKGAKVAVLIPIYNENEDSLKECLEALFNQTHKPDEIHVVNDGSSSDYTKVKTWFLKVSKNLSIKMVTFTIEIVTQVTLGRGDKKQFGIKTSQSGQLFMVAG
jgi:hyaluronan synthase